MERIIQSQTHTKTGDVQRDYYLSQKKTLEINPRHPLIKEMFKRVSDDPNDESAKNMAVVMFETATLRSGYSLKDTAAFAARVEAMMRKTLGVSLDEKIEEGEDDEIEGDDELADDESPELKEEDDDEEGHDEL